MPASTSSHSRPSSSPRRTRATAPAVRWRREIPEPIRALDTLTRFDYTDIVTGAVGDDAPERTPEQWIRLALQGVPRGLLAIVPVIQRGVLGLRLQLRPAPDRLLGWQIAARGEDWLRLEAASWFLTGHVVLHAGRGEVSLATFIRYDRPLARLVWPPVSLVHRQVALALMRSAMRA